MLYVLQVIHFLTKQGRQRDTMISLPRGIMAVCRSCSNTRRGGMLPSWSDCPSGIETLIKTPRFPVFFRAQVYLQNQRGSHWELTAEARLTAQWRGDTTGPTREPCSGFLHTSETQRLRSPRERMCDVALVCRFPGAKHLFTFPPTVGQLLPRGQVAIGKG